MRHTWWSDPDLNSQAPHPSQATAAVFFPLVIIFGHQRTRRYTWIPWVPKITLPVLWYRRGPLVLIRSVTAVGVSLLSFVCLTLGVRSWSDWVASTSYCSRELFLCLMVGAFAPLGARTSRSAFLSLGPIHIWGQILCCGGTFWYSAGDLAASLAPSH